MIRFFALVLPVCLGLSACGTTYTVPEISTETQTKAARIFAEERRLGAGLAGTRKSEEAAIARYRRVVARVEPVAEAFCAEQMADRPGFNCDVQVVIDDRMPIRNAYHTFRNGVPIVAFTMPMILYARNEDELAFVMGHEYGHLIGDHFSKKQQQMLWGGLILAGITAAATSDPHYDPYARQKQIQDMAGIGMGVGAIAYSQEYESEADVIGTHIAEAAGYDPVRGARFFARPEPGRTTTGQLSFWGTHPPDKVRLATVIETRRTIEQGIGLTRRE